MEVQERKVKMPSKSKSRNRRASSSSESKPHSIPAAPNPNGDPPPSPSPRKNIYPNPNSKSSRPPKPSRSSSMLPKSPTISSKPPKSNAVTPDDASADPASPSCKSDRKLKASDFFDDDPATTGGDKGSQAVQRRLTDENAVALIRASINLRSRTGSIPVFSNMATFYNFAKASLPTPLTKEQVYNKLRHLCHLRHKFQKARSSGSGPNNGLVHDICTEVWGTKDKKDDNKVEKVKKDTLVPAIKNGDTALEAAEEKEEQQ